MSERTADAVFEEALVMACQANDPAAFAQLVKRWTPRLIRYLTGMTGHYEVAHDLAQDVWLAVMRGIHHLDNPACFSGWVYRIASRRAADWVQQQQRHRKTLDLQRQNTLPQSCNTSWTSQDSEEVHHALSQLSTAHREAVVLHYLQAMPVAEIAEAVDLPEGTIKSRLHHARKHLKKLLSDERNTL